MLKVVICLSLLAVALSAPQKGSKGTTGQILVSGYSSEIALYTLNGDQLTQDAIFEVDPNLTWLAQEGGSIYASHEIGDYNGVSGGVISRWELENDQLTKKEYVNLESIYPAHFIIDNEHDIAITANYGGSSVTVVSMSNGVLSSVVQTIDYEKCRDDSHPHQIVRWGDLVWVVDLGCDAVYTYRVESGLLVKLGELSVVAGAGPRHMVLKDDLAILLCELQSRVQVYQINPDNGELSFLQEVQLASADDNAGAEILVNGNMVYGSSRGNGVVVAYQLDGQELTRVQELALGMTWPRSIAIKDDIMVAVSKNDNVIGVINIDQENGLLSNGQVVSTPNQPAFVMFIN